MRALLGKRLRLAGHSERPCEHPELVVDAHGGLRHPAPHDEQAQRDREHEAVTRRLSGIEPAQLRAQPRRGPPAPRARDSVGDLPIEARHDEELTRGEKDLVVILEGPHRIDEGLHVDIPLGRAGRGCDDVAQAHEERVAQALTPHRGCHLATIGEALANWSGREARGLAQSGGDEAVPSLGREESHRGVEDERVVVAGIAPTASAWRIECCGDRHVSPLPRTPCDRRPPGQVRASVSQGSASASSVHCDNATSCLAPWPTLIAWALARGAHAPRVGIWPPTPATPKARLGCASA